jgi:hypothetical protein
MTEEKADPLTTVRPKRGTGWATQRCLSEFRRGHPPSLRANESYPNRHEKTFRLSPVPVPVPGSTITRHFLPSAKVLKLLSQALRRDCGEENP